MISIRIYAENFQCRICVRAVCLGWHIALAACVRAVESEFFGALLCSFREYNYKKRDFCRIAAKTASERVVYLFMWLAGSVFIENPFYFFY